MEVNPQPPNIFDQDDLGPPPPPPMLRRQNAVVFDNSVTVNNTQYPIRNVDDIEFIIINRELYNLKTDANGYYIMMADGSNQPVSGGRRSRRRSTRRSKSRRSRRV